MQEEPDANEASKLKAKRQYNSKLGKVIKATRVRPDLVSLSALAVVPPRVKLGEVTDKEGSLWAAAELGQRTAGRTRARSRT